MADSKSTDDLEPRLWKEIDEARIVMLGLVGGSSHHLQPMAAFGDEAQGAVWFYAKTDSDMAREVGAGHDAIVSLMAKDMEFQASIHGRLTLSHDRERIDRYWSPFVSAWYPDGKDDPALTLLRLDASDARLWTANRGTLAYPYQIAKANLTHTLPKVGRVDDVKLG